MTYENQPNAFESDASFVRARELEEQYKDRYINVSRNGARMNPPRNIQREKAELMNSLTNPETGEPYSRDELDRFYLFHVISGGDISMGFPFDMQLDTPDGKLEEFIGSLPDAAEESEKKSEMTEKGYEVPSWLK